MSDPDGRDVQHRAQVKGHTGTPGVVESGGIYQEQGWRPQKGAHGGAE
jgi:hypothetical protein